jgi:uncharacterized delta-60 repeat protein
MKTLPRFFISSAIGSLLFCAALAALIRSASALPADLDLTFNGTGKVTTAIGSIHDEGRSVAIQNDRKIVVAGYSFNGINNDIAVVRYNTDGSLDTSFGGTGKVTTAIDAGDDFGNGYSVAIQSHDGKIVVAAHSFNGANYDIAVVRYNADGSLDTTFNGTGKVTTDFGLGDDKSRSVAVQNDGKIVVAGSAFTGTGLDFAVVRYNTNGTLDTTFNGTGKVTTAIGSSLDEATSVAIQKDGKIVVSGASDHPTTSYDWALVRYNTNGTLDTTFNGTGKLTTDFNNIEGSLGVAVQSDGKIVAVGHSQVVDTDLTLVRYNPNGSLDTTFGGTGKVTTDVGVGDFAFSVAIQSNGKIVVSGSPWITVARYNTNGTLDAAFNGTGVVTSFVGSSSAGRGVAIQGDGKIVVTGGSSNAFAVIRYEGDPTGSINMEYVPVGDLGNPADTVAATNTPGVYFGRVDHAYQIGKYEVTLAQYTAFLNAVAATDPNGLYNPAMDSPGDFRGIGRSGVSGSYKYMVIGDGERPVTMVSMSDAMRFANWMHNGQPTGGQTVDTTEDGTYTLALGGLAPRNPGAAVFIPSEDEWYKAAYYDPTKGGSNYWLYPTRSDDAPGNVIGPLPNQANYFTDLGSKVFSVTQRPDYDPRLNYLTPVGAFTSSGSYYGTFDQGGNVMEWNEALIGALRGLRGNAWCWGGAVDLKSTARGYSDPAQEINFQGFRIATAGPDTDGDGIPNGYETGTGVYVSPFNTGSDPNEYDTDGDGLSDGVEANIYHSNPSVTDTDGDGLTDGWELGIGRFSIVTAASPLSWIEARDDARSRGGELASLPTEDLWNRVRAALGETALDEMLGVWIGASDAEVEGEWKWVNGRPFGFANWGTGRPSAVPGNTLAFLEISGGDGAEIWKWYDRSGTSTRLNYLFEAGYATDPTKADADGDGLNDGEEQAAGSNPFLADTDSDGLTDSQEVRLTQTNPTKADTDGDGTGDAVEDPDEDGLNNLAEVAQYGTNPLVADSDADGVNDGAEVGYAGSFYKLVQGTFTYPQAVADATSKHGRVASFPNAADYWRMANKARRTTQGYLWIGLSDATTEGTWLWTDGTAATYSRWLTGQPDGGAAENHVVIMENSTQWADTAESYVAAGYIFERVGLDPLDPDTDADGLNDGQEINTTHSSPVLDDTDGDGLLDGAEVNTHGSSPLLTDTDADGLNDRVEVEVYHSNPALKDSDGDLFDDLFEVNTGFDPALATSTPDALSSIRTAVEFRFNAANGISYRIEASTDLDQWDIIEPVVIGASAVVTRFYSIENQPKRYFRVRRN